ncbi:hypothetical protein GGR34_000729 [Microvirga flocculans]|uniref:Uncharacterized protein n=1 Tax=Microvirga flocculans TaxID=217168 RepID=A0A7W6ICX7_9HYPH|nr:hypothetical protein [Microvirga flocculans]MBB4039094.1 hypothetical protein [Microvirga flocculans]
MREARIIVPLKDNDGNDLTAVHTFAKHALCRKFGGFTATPISGGWMDDDGTFYEDHSIAYDIAMVPDRQDDVLRDLVLELGVMARQLAMYCRYASGTVEIIDTSKALAA